MTTSFQTAAALAEDLRVGRITSATVTDELLADVIGGFTPPPLDEPGGGVQ